MEAIVEREIHSTLRTQKVDALSSWNPGQLPGGALELHLE